MVPSKNNSDDSSNAMAIAASAAASSIIAEKIGRLTGLVELLISNFDDLKADIKSNRDEREKEFRLLPCVLHADRIKGLEVKAGFLGGIAGAIMAGIITWIQRHVAP